MEAASIAELQRLMASGQLTTRQLVQSYLDRIGALDRQGPTLRSILEINPQGLTIAAALDDERRTQGPRGPLHGVPILLKGNIDTADMMTLVQPTTELPADKPRSKPVTPSGQIVALQVVQSVSERIFFSWDGPTPLSLRSRLAIMRPEETPAPETLPITRPPPLDCQHCTGTSPGA